MINELKDEVKNMTANAHYVDLNSLTYFRRPGLVPGGPYGPLISYSERVEKIVNEKNLESYTNKVSSNYAATPESVIIRGGIRVPHLHHNGEIYLLNKEQWNEFTGEIIKDFKRKLDEAQNMSFSQFMELSDLMNDFI